jgi:hypothetical protein
VFAQLHELVKPEGVGEPIDCIEKTGNEDALENLVVREAGRPKRIDVLISNLVGMLGQLYAQTEQRLVLLLDRQRFDICRLGSLRLFLAASYGPQEK